MSLITKAAQPPAIEFTVMVGGGLGTFLLGMKHLSEGLQAVSGSGLRKFMSLATTHRVAWQVTC